MMEVNKNVLWSEIFINRLVNLGVSYACISPGSRNTPLTSVLANNEKIKTYINIDERSSGFFALGLAKASGKPVLLASTSGTAAAELYPAIIEAYQQHIPLIVCTADRSPELLDNGSNQTINQNNIFANHIAWHFNSGIPEVIPARLKHINAIARRAYYESLDNGPVHINFPFRKPLEPSTHTDEVDEALIAALMKDEEIISAALKPNSSIDLAQITNKLSAERGIIITGPGNYPQDLYINCLTFSESYGYPILADASSGFRTCGITHKNIITNYDAFLRSNAFMAQHQADVIIQFGRNITSKGLEDYLNASSAYRIMVNRWGDWTDSSNGDAYPVKMEPSEFCLALSKMQAAKAGNEWLNSFIKADDLAGKLRGEFLASAGFPFEGKIFSEVLSVLPNDSALMVSNSMPIRDIDFFSSALNKKIYMYNNRGASGIDGIASTALGIAAASGKRTALITGDLAFYYDLNGLLASMKYEIPLTVILINNNGGGIFEMLPVSKERERFNEFFITPHNLEFSHFVKGYNGTYSVAESWDELKDQYKAALVHNNLSVIEIKTDSYKSTKERREFWGKTALAIDNAYKNK